MLTYIVKTALYIFFLKKVILSPLMFEEEKVHDFAAKYSSKMYTWSSGSTPAEYVETMLSKTYPDVILNSTRYPWITSYTGGGLHGRVRLLYASSYEMLVLYQSLSEVNGASGRHAMNISFTCLEGKVDILHEKTSETEEVLPGKTGKLALLESAHITLSPGTSMLIYIRGFPIITSGYWIADIMLSHCDILLAFKTFFQYMKATLIGNVDLYAAVKQLLEYVKKYDYINIYNKDIKPCLIFTIQSFHDILAICWEYALVAFDIICIELGFDVY